ncbi:MAG TPA: NUDIX hydrolase [Fimbriiglobus sp.]|jgi:8-oxo-dGTP pyrophosphatase MutT (NUDIX family)
MPDTNRQAAVIPVRDGRVCMVTSSSGKRWVIPKGQIDVGFSAGEAALLEAWEEAGLLGAITPEPVGSYFYEKEGRSHLVTVFLLAVTEVKDVWPERFLRKREWVEPDQALERIEEEGLKSIIRSHFVGAESLASGDTHG